MVVPWSSAIGFSIITILAAPTSAAEFACPPSIAVRKTFAVPEGWKRIAGEATAQLHGANLYLGVPENRARLKPDNAETDDVGMVWEALGNGYWLTCDYHGSGYELAQPVPGTPEACREVVDGGAWTGEVRCE